MCCKRLNGYSCELIEFCFIFSDVICVQYFVFFCSMIEYHNGINNCLFRRGLTLFQKSLYKTLQEKEKLLLASNFSFFQCFLSVWKNFFHFHQIRNCRLQSLNSFTLEKSNICRLGKSSVVHNTELSHHIIGNT